MQTKNIHGINDKELFKNHEDYWQVADNIRDIYMSDGSLTTLLDFERVLDEMDIYAFKNWEIGELVAGPDINKYTVGVTFMWPEKMMPDPRGGKRCCHLIAKSHTKSKRSKSPSGSTIRQIISLAPKKPGLLKSPCGW
jgi:hypothetical protein